MPADAAPADALPIVDVEKFKCRTTVRTTERPGHFPHAGCVLDISHAQVLRPPYSVGAPGGNVLIVRSVDLADGRLEEIFLTIA